MIATGPLRAACYAVKSRRGMEAQCESVGGDKGYFVVACADHEG
jgi:hypothetical protein